LSGHGAQLFGGRFNPKGVPALYTALSPDTAIRESNQVGTLQPTLLLAYQADIEPVFDATDAKAMALYGFSEMELASPDWRNQVKELGLAATQQFAQQLMGKGYAGLRVRSFARGADVDAINLVLWSWGDSLPTFLQVIDDENRLS
jgi:RES domain-containing protein